MKRIFSVITELNLNRNEGTFAFIMHRLTGLCLVAYIFLHLTVVGSDFLIGKGAFNRLMGSFEWPLFKALEICLISVIAFHLLNGLRLILIDLLSITKTQRWMFWTVMVFCLAAFIITAVVFLPKIL